MMILKSGKIGHTIMDFDTHYDQNCNRNYNDDKDHKINHLKNDISIMMAMILIPKKNHKVDDAYQTIT